jgi:hypothetical protein
MGLAAVLDLYLHSLVSIQKVHLAFTLFFQNMHCHVRLRIMRVYYTNGYVLGIV